MENCEVIAITNQKGGVGKTTTAASLGIGLANQGKKVLLIDLDPQASLTLSLGQNNPDNLPVTVSDVMRNIIDDGELTEPVPVIKSDEGVDLLPANIELCGVEVQLVNEMSREQILKTYIETVKKDYDYYDFQITNHNLFLTANKHNNILKESPYVIIDEAHKLSETARDIYGQEINETTIGKYLNMVKYHCKSDVKLSSYKELINSINAMNTVLFQSFKRAMRNNVELEKDFLINLSIAEKQTIQNLIDYIQTLESYKTALKGRVELQGERIIENLESLLKEDRVSIWLKMEEDETITVCSMDNHVGVNLERDLWKKTRGYALLSGTMSNGVDFDFFKKENGIDVVPSRKIKESYTKSPFDYSNNTRLYIPEDLPLPSNSCSEQYINAISDRIVELVKATNGHTAILFTSYKVLYLVYENTKDKLCEYDLFCMSRSNRNAISDFKKSNNGVLFASGSMWEGVDCQGDVLSSVIIVRLPFPLRSVSAELKKMEYDNDVKFINEYIVPTMLIKLRQGMGRLIRNENDTGLISILDTRARRRYTEDVKNVTSRFPQIESIDEIKEFFREVKAESYFEN